MAKNLGSLNVGDLVEVAVKPDYHSFLGKQLVFKVADKNHPGYPDNSVTLITDKLIGLMEFDNEEPTNSDEERKIGGNNYYPVSNIHQWLNSTGPEGDWYTPQHNADAPPSYIAKAGFLAMFNDKFVTSLMDTDVITAKDMPLDADNETINARMFLPSNTEVGLYFDDTQGTKLVLFSDGFSRVAHPTAAFVLNQGGRLDPETKMFWYLRTPMHGPGSSGMTAFVSSDESHSGYSYYYAVEPCVCPRPLCNLSNTCTISDTKNSRGNYVLYPKAPPSISGTDSDLGTKYEGFSYDYTVTDPESEAVTVTEKVNDTILRTYTPELGQVQTLSLSGEAFSSLPNAIHTITITAADSADNVFTRTLTFTKSISGFEIVLKNPLTATIQPRRVYVDVMREIPAGGSFKVEVTNNPYDPEPVWEDCTMAVLRHLCHIFKNTVNEAEQFGVNVHVTVKRGRALTVCWVSGIEINFE